MDDDRFVPLSFYFPPRFLSFIEISEDSLDKIGILQSRVERVLETIDGEQHEETFYDEIEGREIIMTWTEAEIKRETKIISTIVNQEELPCRVPGLDSIELVIASTESPGASPFTATMTIHDDGSSSFTAGIVMKLRFSRGILKPMKETDEGFVEKPGEVEIDIGKVNLVLNSDGFHIDAGSQFEINRPLMIGDTGVIIHYLTGLALNLTGDGLKPENAPDDWKGIYLRKAKLSIPDVLEDSIEAEGLGIGSGGIYGRIEYESSLIYDENSEEFTGDLSGKVLGMEGGISSIALEFYQNIPVKSEIKGKILLPFFDEPVSISIGIGTDGNFHVTLADTDEDGIYVLRKEGILEARIETISFEKKEDLFIASLSGSIRPLVKDIAWPEIDVEKLSIDSKGNVHIDGGWIDTREKESFDFHGFKVEVTQVGFGSDEDKDGRYRWIGLSGKIQLIEGLEGGGSVEGLRIKWWDTEKVEVELKGVGVNFVIPDILAFDGEVAFLHDGIKGFKGDIRLDLMCLGLKMEAALVIGKRPLGEGEFTFLYIYLNAELPHGIPLGCSGIGFYGMAGVFGYNMEPNKEPSEKWYDDDTGWHKRPPKGATSPDKWRDKKEALAFGSGVTLGTIADNGYTVSAKTLLVIVLPGPIILIEGTAAFLRKRAALDEEGPFRALAIIDNRAGQFLLNIEATYKFDKEGRVVDIHGGAEAFFDYRSMNNWHLYLGEREPRDKRIRAEILRIFGAETYFMLEPVRFAWGFWYGFDKKWKFGPVRMAACAWAEGGIDVSNKPYQFWGKIWMHGGLDVRVFWFNFGFCLDTGIEGNTPTPYFILAAFRIGINLPWPLPDFKIRIRLKWEKDREPPWPLPLKEAAISHEIVQENIVLPRGALLLPNYDLDNDEFIDDEFMNDDLCEDSVETPDDIPVVPLDARPVLTFGKPVWDTAEVGNNSYPLKPEWQVIGHCGDETLKDYEYKFELRNILLQKENDSGWEDVAGTNSQNNPLYGTWLPAEDGEGNPTQTKLQLWTKTPFSYTRYSTRDYEDGFIEDNLNYPCVPDYRAKKVCVNFDDLPLGKYGRELEHHGIRFRASEDFSITKLASCIKPYQKGGITNENTLETQWTSIYMLRIFITLPDTIYWVSIDLYKLGGLPEIEFLDKDRNVISVDEKSVALGEGQNHIEVDKKAIKYLAISDESQHPIHFCIFNICYITVSEHEKEEKYKTYRRRTQTMLAHWYGKGNILEPYTKYRLKIETNVTRKMNSSEKSEPICEYAFFRTEGPPGFAELALFRIYNDVDAIVGDISKLKNKFSEHGIYLSDSSSLKQNEENKWKIKDGKRTFLVEKGDNILTVYAEAGHEHPLNRLDSYVRGTIPRNGQHPYYRAYDMGIAFNQDYVELMYKIAKQDLWIYLFDNDGQPVRDAFGRIIAFGNVWGKPEEIELTEEEEIYVWLMENSLCIDFDRNSIPKKDIHDYSAQDRFLLPQKLYEARVIPLLLHETFESGGIEGWQIVDEGKPLHSSKWEVTSDPSNSSIQYLRQTRDVYKEGDCDPGMPLCRGTYAFYEGDWTDYRVTAVLASGDDGAIGVMFRYQDENNYYRFSMDRKQKYRRLVKIESDTAYTLAEDEWTYKKGRTYTVTIEAVKGSITVFIDGEPVFNVTDRNPFSRGKIALYCRANLDARFYEVVVEDLSEDAVSVHNFQFSSSRYANFYHHIHSFNDTVWTARLPEGSDLQSEKFEKKWPEYIQLPQRVEIDLIKKNDQNVGFLLKSPEPIEWERVCLSIMKHDTLLYLGMPGTVKLTSFGKEGTNQWIDVLVREDTPLFDWKIEYAEDPENPQWKPFHTFKGFKLFSKTKFSDEDFVSLPSEQGFSFIDGDSAWSNYRTTIDFELGGDYEEAGILFRYKDEENYYKLAVSNEGGMKLFKRVSTSIILLWPLYVENEPSEPSNDPIGAEKELLEQKEYGKQRHRLTVEVNESTIRVFGEGECIEVEDRENPIARGCVGAFFISEAEVTFRELSVVDLQRASFCSGQLIRIYNPIEDQDTHFTNVLTFTTETLLPEISDDSGVVFRILDANETTIHKRSFLSDQEYTGECFSLVPSIDGTAAFISLNSGSVAEDCLYRFKFTFSRKNGNLPLLKQWGCDDAEYVTIEFVPFAKPSEGEIIAPGIFSTFNLYYDMVELYIRVNKEAYSNRIYEIEILRDAQQPRWDNIEAVEAPQGWSFEKIVDGVRFSTETNPLLKSQRVKFKFRVTAKRISWYMRIHVLDHAHKSIGMIVSTRWWLYHSYL